MKQFDKLPAPLSEQQLLAIKGGGRPSNVIVIEPLGAGNWDEIDIRFDDSDNPTSGLPIHPAAPERWLSKPKFR